MSAFGKKKKKVFLTSCLIFIHLGFLPLNQPLKKCHNSVYFWWWWYQNCKNVLQQKAGWEIHKKGENKRKGEVWIAIAGNLSDNEWFGDSSCCFWPLHSSEDIFFFFFSFFSIHLIRPGGSGSQTLFTNTQVTGRSRIKRASEGQLQS